MEGRRKEKIEKEKTGEMKMEGKREGKMEGA